MVLLHLLHSLAGENRWRLMVAHLNHKLRGRSSDADERLVRQTAKKLGLPAVVERHDVRAFARTNKLSIEMAARKLRHDFLVSLNVLFQLAAMRKCDRAGSLNVFEQLVLILHEAQETGRQLIGLWRKRRYLAELVD